MKESNNEYYVYVYIDPRNFEEFYYGKGKNNRKEEHKKEDNDSAKSKRIKSIQKEGLEPIVKVIARNLSEHDAFLVEKTLLWKLGKGLTNISSGHYSDNFRPDNTMHLNLSGFDYRNGIYYYNVGEGKHRNWDDYQTYGFISAGQGIHRRDSILKFEEGDIIVAYLKSKGYVGIGLITEKAKPAREIKIDNKSLDLLNLECPNIMDNSNSEELSEYIALVKWIKHVDRKNAKWQSKAGLFTTQQIRASLDNQSITIKFLEESFGLNFNEIRNKNGVSE